jgi:hypothetical protein
MVFFTRGDDIQMGEGILGALLHALAPKQGEFV